VYTQGKFAFSDTTDRGQKARSVHLRLPPTRRACKEGAHTFSQYVGSDVRDGVRVMIARCPDCFQEITFPELAKDRREA